jgi:hypothetical protein
MIQNKKIFISYSDNDQANAIKLCEVLESSGFKCWLSYRDTIPGKNFLENIFEAMSNSALMIVLFSEKALSEKRMVQEAELGFDTEIPIIPLRIENAEAKGVMKFVLGTLQWIEAFENPFEEYFPQIISAVNRSLEIEEQNKKDSQPPTPEAQTAAVGSQHGEPESSPGKSKENEQKPSYLLGPEKVESPLPQQEKKEYLIYSHEKPQRPYAASKKDVEELENMNFEEKGKRFDIFFSEEKNEVIIRGKVKDFFGVRKEATQLKKLLYLFLSHVGSFVEFLEIALLIWDDPCQKSSDIHQLRDRLVKFTGGVINPFIKPGKSIINKDNKITDKDARAYKKDDSDGIKSDRYYVKEAYRGKEFKYCMILLKDSVKHYEY